MGHHGLLLTDTLTETQQLSEEHYQQRISTKSLTLNCNISYDNYTLSGETLRAST